MTRLIKKVTAPARSVGAVFYSGRGMVPPQARSAARAAGRVCDVAGAVQRVGLELDVVSGAGTEAQVGALGELRHGCLGFPFHGVLLRAG